MQVQFLVRHCSATAKCSNDPERCGVPRRTDHSWFGKKQFSGLTELLWEGCAIPTCTCIDMFLSVNGFTKAGRLWFYVSSLSFICVGWIWSTSVALSALLPLALMTFFAHVLSLLQKSVFIVRKKLKGKETFKIVWLGWFFIRTSDFHRFSTFSQLEICNTKLDEMVVFGVTLHSITKKILSILSEAKCVCVEKRASN